MKTFNLAIAAVLTVAAVPAFAGTDRYEFHRDCVFQSATFGEFKIRVMKDHVEHDRLMLVQSQMQPMPVAFDDLPKMMKDDCGRSLKKIVAPYNMGAITELKFYEDSVDVNYGRLKIVFRTSVPVEQGCGHSTCSRPAMTEEVLEVGNCGTTPQW